MTCQKTNEKLIAKCNEFSRLLYKSMGYEVPRGFRFDRATHPQELSMWNQATMACYFFTGETPDDKEMEDDDE